MYVVPYLARRAILSARRAVFIDWRPASLGTMSVSAKFTRLMSLSAKFNREPCRKKTRAEQGEAPDKILRHKDQKRLAQARAKARSGVDILRPAV